MKYKVFQMALVQSSCKKIKMQLSQQHLLKGPHFSNVSFQPFVRNSIAEAPWADSCSSHKPVSLHLCQHHVVSEHTKPVVL